VSVAAVVRDRKGRFVRDLEKNDFVIAESGRPKPIIDFRSESDGPVRLALLFDVSGSMRVASRAVDARQAAKHLLSSLRPDDMAALFSFDTRLSLVRGFTSDIDSLLASLDQVESPYGQTSLYDAVAQTARTVAEEKQDRLAQVQRRAVVVLTDGIDTRSRLTAADVSAIASNIDVPVYVLAMMHAVDDPRDQRTEEGDSALRNLAHWTGGELFISTAPAHASVAARRIVDELRHQYVLAFEGSGRPGWHALEVRARDRDLVVRARAGYMALSGGAEVP
jgi:VWFA-related protein